MISDGVAFAANDDADPVPAGQRKCFFVARLNASGLPDARLTPVFENVTEGLAALAALAGRERNIALVQEALYRSIVRRAP